jgi:hypothetical protein
MGRAKKPSTRQANTRSIGGNPTLQAAVDARLTVFLAEAQSARGSQALPSSAGDLHLLIMAAFQDALPLFPPSRTLRERRFLPSLSETRLNFGRLARSRKPLTDAQVAAVY